MRRIRPSRRRSPGIIAATALSLLASALIKNGDTYPRDMSPAERPAERTLMLATTTSVDATGLLDVLADAFKADTGITLKWIAVGTGAALKQARDGNADAVIAHARKLEAEFIRDGYGVNRRVFARNFFMVVGPPDDPARVAGVDLVR